MNKSWSSKFQLDKESIKRLLQKAFIFYTPVILVLLDQIQKWNIDYKILYAMGLGLTFRPSKEIYHRLYKKINNILILI